MTNVNSNWDRLASVIRWANMSVNYFGRHIGLARSETLYQIKAGHNGISQNLARRIVEKFPEISLGWLLSGEGEMFAGGKGGKIPFYDCDVCGQLLRQLSQAEARCRLNIPLLEECDLAARSYDVAMSGEIMAGSIVFLKHTVTDAIIPGGIYVVVCENYVLLRKVYPIKSEVGGAELTLESADGNHNVIKLSVNEVRDLYRVVGNLKLG
ncbi:MAG: hypothetical protein J6L01_01365 [Alistipes sp.]|nr:hypothetical protein [Alistipes sp.]